MKLRYFVAFPMCCLLSACNDKVLFTPPERRAANAPAPAVADSVVTLVASLPYATLARIAGERLPQS